MKKEKHTFDNYQFKHTAVSVANHPDTQTQDVAEALKIHPFMLSRWKMQLVRHPGYAGNLLALPGIVLALSSMWALIPAAALIIAVIRTALEDRTLKEELPGYRDYAKRVRFRLIPGIY